MSLLQETARKAAGLLGRESWLIRRLRPAYESLHERSNNGIGIRWKIHGVTYLVDPHQRHRLGQNYDALSQIRAPVRFWKSMSEWTS